jgi:membrane protein YqaA with SNARE-associated domain
MVSFLAYGGLFLSATGAATILPMQSEAVLVGMILTEQFETWTLIAIASAGNVLGSIANWLLGRWIERFQSRRWFSIRESALARARSWYRRYGKWSLLASWVPIIGDPITMVAGVMREPLMTFIILVTIAKTARYVVLALATQGLT